jgi:hypothetical protein
MSFRSQDELIRDLAYRGREIEVIFILGSGLTTPPAPGRKGVPSAKDMIKILEDLVAQDADELKNSFAERFSDASSKDYQATFSFLLEHNFPETVIAKAVRTAVLKAYNQGEGQFMDRVHLGSKDACIEVELDHQRWDLRPGISSLGEIVSGIPKVFGRTILTTNFDPLIEIAVRQAGGSPVSTRMDRDGSLQNIDAWSHIIHVHGYWHGSEMLHTKLQITAKRPKLQTSLNKLMEDCEVVVLGYGGWDDVLLKALQNLANDSEFNIHWCFNEPEPEQHEACRNVLQKLPNDSEKILFYSGIDCDIFLPKLRDRLIELGSVKQSDRDIRLKVLEQEKLTLRGELNEQKALRRDEREEVSGRRDLLRAQNELTDRLKNFDDEIRFDRQTTLEANQKFEEAISESNEKSDKLVQKIEESLSVAKNLSQKAEQTAKSLKAIKRMVIPLLLLLALAIAFLAIFGKSSF